MSGVTVSLNEEQRQIVLLALHDLKVRRPGWAQCAIGPIEQALGGQLDWPPVSLTALMNPEMSIDKVVEAMGGARVEPHLYRFERLHEQPEG